jgi:hypothetical protein
MNLLRILNEASATPIEDLKDQMKRDKRVSMIFSRSLEPDEIADKKQFLLTLRYYLLNNKEVLNFIKDRAGLNVSTYTFDTIRKYSVSDIEDPNKLENLRKTVADIFRDAGRVKKKDLSGSSISYLYDYLLNAKTTYFTPHVANELKTLKLTSKTPVKLYYGINFTEYDFDNIREWTGNKATTRPGPAVEFKNSINVKTKEVNLDFSYPKVLTTSLKKAELMAKYGDYRHESNTFRGEVGYVVSILVPPSKQVLSISAYTAAGAIGFDRFNDFFIVDSGKYRGKIVKKLTPSGEEDVLDDERSSKIDDIVKSIKFVNELVSPVTYNDTRLGITDNFAFFRTGDGKKAISWLLSPEGKKAVLRRLKLLYEIFLRIHKIEESEFKKARMIDEQREIVNAVSMLYSILKTVFSEDSLSLGRAKEIRKPEEILNPPEMRLNKAIKAIRAFLYAAARDTRYTVRYNLYDINSTFRTLGIDPGRDIHRKSKAFQAELADKLIDNFFDIIQQPVPDDKNEQIKAFLAGYQQLQTLLSAIQAINNSVDQIKIIVKLAGEED